MRSPSFRCRAALCAVRRGPGGSQWGSALPTQVQAPQSEAVAPGAARYCAPCSCGCGRQRGQGSLRCLSLCLRCVASATASGTGHCPARTPPNAVPWVCPEKDTFLSGQLLVVGRRPSGSNWANEISRDEVPRARCERSAERRLREAGGGAAGGGYFWPCARYSCGAHARGFRKRSILRLWFMTEGCVWPRRKPVGVGTADRRQQVAPGPARQAQPACPAALVRVKLNTLPLPGSLCTRMVSPMAWRISLAIDRPRPEPELPCDLSTL